MKILACILMIGIVHCVEFGIYGYNVKDNTFITDENSGLSISHVVSITVDQLGLSKEDLMFLVKLNQDGSKLNEDFTKRMLGKRIAIIVNDKMVASPVVIVASKDEFAVTYHKDKFENDFSVVFKGKFKK